MGSNGTKQTAAKQRQDSKSGSQTIGWLEVAVKDARGVRCDESVENTQRYADSLLLHQEAACVRVSLRGWGGERCRRGYPSFMGRGL